MTVDYSSYKTLKCERRDKVLVVTLNRPEVLNAVNLQMHNELARIWGDIAHDRDTNVVVVTGAGRAFCAGADLKSGGAASTPEGVVDKDALMGFGGKSRSKQMINDMVDLDKPIIAMVNGVATGLGITLVFFSDMIIASEKASFADHHIKMGAVPGGGGAVIFPLVFGLWRAKQYLMTGSMVSAAEAYNQGLINQVTPHEKLEEVTMELANRLASGPSVAIRLTKRVMNRYLHHAMDLVYEAGHAAEAFTMLNSEDRLEAKRAWLEKRKPVFRGK